MRALEPEVVDVIWAAVEPMLPVRPVGDPGRGHRPRIPDRLCFWGILVRLATGCSWQCAEALLGWQVSDTTLRSRRDEWVAAGVFELIAAEAIAAYDRIVGLDLDDVCVDGSTHKAPCGGEGTGKSPVDRRKLGWKWSIAIDGAGIAVGWAAAGANRNDIMLFDPTIAEIERQGLHHDTETLHLDRGYWGARVDNSAAKAGITDLVRPPKPSWVASDFARQVLSFFKQRRAGFAVSGQEAAADGLAGTKIEDAVDSRAEVRLVGADARRAGHPGPGGRGGGRGPVGDQPAARCCTRRRDCGFGFLEAGPASAVACRGDRGGGFARGGGAARPHGGRAGSRAGGAAGKNGLGMSGPVPARVGGTAKASLLGLIDDAASAGWTLGRVCMVLGLDRRRAWRWAQRRAEGALDDARPGGRPVHGLLGWERDEIVALFAEWGDTDRSHRKLAHRGSYLGRVWVSPSSVDRVLAGHGLALAGTPRPKRAARTPWPAWCEWRPNQLWCWDGTQFPACKSAKHAYAIVDVVSRKWIATHLTPAPDSVAARVLFAEALHNEGLLTAELAARLADPDAEPPRSDDIPLLLAVSDNGPEMRAGDTARFMALCSIAQHFGRPSTPTDQAWIESLFAHVKTEHPHLETLTDPADLARELERVRSHHNTMRLHEAIGYVTPHDEHTGNGDQIRAARRAGLQRADAQRRSWHRNRPLP